MTTVVIAYEVPDNKVDAVRQYLDQRAFYDVNWNGAEFTIERGDFTCIKDDESANAVALLHGVFEVLAELSALAKTYPASLRVL